MTEQDIELQILEELQKLKEIVIKVREAENAYSKSLEILEKTSKEYSGLASLKEDLNEQAVANNDNLSKTFLAWEEKNAKLIVALNEDFTKLKGSLLSEESSKLDDIKKQITSIKNSLSSISEEVSQLKKQQTHNKTYIRIGLYLIAILAFILLIFK